ncbi:protein phosphatase 1 regulatory subunit 1A isoform X2 [Camarhynchus parvulus]|uniref:protein phosphatase 1 regulatory subunit 1A isoform X2 n=1 Tax=Geospiza parvula TaxID=87175 RepID=UPI001237A41A|nr:protein phosphatase 1 regulatory subunit 1A isoform X2 [Camarhynchus parvulus]
MEPNSPRKIQFTVPLLEPHLDPEAAEQIRRRRPTPANLVLSSDQSSPEIDEDRLPNPLLKSGLAMSPRQRKKVSRSTPTMKGAGRRRRRRGGGHRPLPARRHRARAPAQPRRGPGQPPDPRGWDTPSGDTPGRDPRGRAAQPG